MITGLQIGFTVTNPSVKTNPLVFQTVKYNSEEGYDTSTGKFVCSYPGIHVFIATIMVKSVVDATTSCYIYLNDEQKVYVLSTNQNSADIHYVPGTNSFVTYLNVGDEVYMSSCVGTMRGRNWANMDVSTTFSGFLVNP